MNKIHVLPLQEAQKIAAGEVVERPASVVKELLENALDAGATKISLHIDNGAGRSGSAGSSRIRIVDNGCGMSVDDAKMCIVTHATSKIKTLADLDQVRTFGFRGEALSTVSSVSKLTIITKEKSDAPTAGVKLYVENNTIQKQESVACSVGTQIDVQDLFYNTPARKKFLSRDETEFNHIAQLVYAFCLSNLHVHFTLYKNGEQVLSAPSTSNAIDRASQLWQDISGHCVELTQQEVPKSYPVKLSGFIIHHQYTRYNKNRIFFFVNGRYVKNPSLSRALLKGYLNVLPPMKFPAGCVYLEVDQSSIDVNVHPRKEEILFSKPRLVESAITVSVTSTLEALFARKLAAQSHSSPHPFDTTSYAKAPSATQGERWSDLPPLSHTAQPQEIIQQPTPSLPPPALSDSQSELYRTGAVENGPNFESASIIGQLKTTYILLDHPDGLLMVDQHAAHERIMYEKFRAGFLQREGTRLLFPETIEATSHELELLEAHAEFFTSQGVELDILSANKLAIKSAPPKVHASLREFMREAIDFMVEHERIDKEAFAQKLREHVHAQMACKAAIKAGDVLSHEAMAQLLKDLSQTDNRFICAHGRPTMWQVSFNEIERNFKRKV